jgi:glycine cleavage system H protein
MQVPKDVMYTKEHEWVRIEDNKVTVGVTDYAQHQLGDIVFVELPEINDEVAKGGSFAVLESVKAVANVYAPVTGMITAVNEDLLDDPALVNSSPYEKGWLVAFEVENPDELELLTPNQYKEFIEGLE